MSVVAVGRDTRTEIGDSCEDTPERVHHHHQHPVSRYLHPNKISGHESRISSPINNCELSSGNRRIETVNRRNIVQAAASSSITPALFEWSIDEREMVN
jgi:hypothetical protein